MPSLYVAFEGPTYPPEELTYLAPPFANLSSNSEARARFGGTPTLDHFNLPLPVVSNFTIVVFISATSSA